MLTLAIQKKGRLATGSLELLEHCGIHFEHNGQEKLKTEALNFPLEMLFLRDDDIPRYVEDGVADIGIVGENVALESAADILKVLPLGFGKCRMSIAVPKHLAYTGVQDLQDKRIATSYPRLLKKFLNRNKVSAQIHEISGSVEITPGINMADAIFDIVSTGSTLISNGLREVELVLHSEAAVYRNRRLNPGKLALLENLCFRIQAVNKAKDHKYILLNVPNEKLEQVCRILPGMKSPTIMPLGEPGWSSVHSVIKEDKFWEIIQQLKDAGAESLLVTDIEKMIL
ncbi:MAG: ATP phosphoribosyltransferase [Candidatus Marinimicrobia bacterium]|jgi:ATP phosphoribosyltransferase|nr:ATP phosphoribosyltransferase [Candidatus Neomarinimicrobiota bacterium]MDD4961141.1 ATP phosphoribosyltransferase [Candidatus Neomarinimicrobiota bacterium]MDD5709056.1 ATP phosphoribosyltransferase [Candidatus Neomarinimicrobiota bacterium]MDX9777599.1 ATP phosphoribosyltransferase [bacterium]